MNESTNDFVSARRQDDAVISVCQDNSKKTVLISKFNQVASRLLQYDEEKLLNKPLTDIVNKETVDKIKEFLEYTDSGYDLYDILSKASNFSIVDSKGNNIETTVKVFRTTQYTSNKINYELLIRDISLHQKLKIFKEKYLMNKKHTYHDSLQELYVVLSFALEYKIDAAIGIIGLSSTELNSKDKINNALSTIDDHFRKNSRSDDLVGYIDESKMFFILLNCDSKNTPKVVNRIYSVINKQLKKQNISIIYGNIVQKLAVKKRTK